MMAEEVLDESTSAAIGIVTQEIEQMEVAPVEVIQQVQKQISPAASPSSSKPPSSSSSFLPPTSTPASPPPKFHCIFAAPSLTGEGIATHTTYAIHTRWAPSTELSNSKVYRRYSDFLFLQQQLITSYPSYLIPCLPPKDFANRFEHSFIAARRRGLLKFLACLAEHKVLSEYPLIIPFLRDDPNEWESRRESIVRQQKPSILSSLQYFNNKIVNSL